MSAATPQTHALDLVEQAEKLLYQASCEGDYEDPRGILLRAMVEVWDRTAPMGAWTSILDDEDRRWSAASILLGHDTASRTVYGHDKEAATLLAQIVEQAADLISLVEETNSSDRSVEARELREAIDRLCSIAYAVTAIHLVGKAAS